MNSVDKQTSSGREIPPPSRRLNQPFWIAFAVLLCVQIGIAVGLCFLTGGREFANDASDYHLYLQNPHILLTDFSSTRIGGGFVASPFLPYSIYLPYQVFSWLGIPAEYQQFLGMRLVVISWVARGMILSWRVLQQTWNIQPTVKDRLFTLLILCMPLTIIASAVMTQDDGICFAWASLGLYCWHRWGVRALLIVMRRACGWRSRFCCSCFPPSG